MRGTGRVFVSTSFSAFSVFCMCRRRGRLSYGSGRLPPPELGGRLALFSKDVRWYPASPCVCARFCQLVTDIRGCPPRLPRSPPLCRLHHASSRQYPAATSTARQPPPTSTASSGAYMFGPLAHARLQRGCTTTTSTWPNFVRFHPTVSCVPAMASVLKAALVAVLALAVAGAHAQCSGYTSCDSCAGSGECKDRWNREGGNHGRVLERKECRWGRGVEGAPTGGQGAREARDTRATRVLAGWGNDRPLNGRMGDGANELEERRRFCARFLDSERDEDKVGAELFPLCPPRSLPPSSLLPPSLLPPSSLLPPPCFPPRFPAEHESIPPSLPSAFTRHSSACASSPFFSLCSACARRRRVFESARARARTRVRFCVRALALVASRV